MVSKCTVSLGQINRVEHLLNKKSFLTAINTLVFQTPFYCSTVWANTSKHVQNKKKLKSVQNFAARIVTGSPLLKELCWLPVNVPLHFRDVMLACKCLNGYAPEYLTERFITRSQIQIV